MKLDQSTEVHTLKSMHWFGMRAAVKTRSSSCTLVACFTADYKPFYIVVNCGIMFICVIGKFPQMHRVRIFGINSTPGIDQPIEYSPSKSDLKRSKGKGKKN